MLNKKFLQANKELFLESCKKRNHECNFEYFEELYKKTVELKSECDKLKFLQKQNKENNDAAKEIKQKIKVIEAEHDLLNDKLEKWLQTQPNLLLPEVHAGVDEADNKIIFVTPDQLKTHEITHDKLIKNLIMYDESNEISGSRFVIFKDKLSTLKHGLMNFLLDQNKKAGYSEYSVPYLVLEETCFGTGQFPKFKEEAFETNNNKWLISTGEIPLVNMWRNFVFNKEDLPKLSTTFSPCFRKEAGSAGKDLKGLIRLHQFHKVELVTICAIEDAEKYHQKQLETAKNNLNLLGLPYRVLLHCGGDTGFTAVKQYDIEVWMPGMKKYLEIASCSNCGTFQAMRSNIKMKTEEKNEFCATLNGSSLPIERLIAAIFENYFNGISLVKMPEALKPYLPFEEIEI